MRIFFITFFIGSFFSAAAQQRCSTIENPVNAISPNNIQYKQEGIVPEDIPVITIPVVVHILYNDNNDNISTEQVLSQITALNKDFAALNDDINKVPAAFKLFIADTRIRFELARVDPEGRATNGIVRKKTYQSAWKQDDRMKFADNGGSDAWDSRYYLNIWVCRLGSGMLGYASFPGAAAEKDGVVIRSDIFGTINIEHTVYNKGRTATHEIGHWLNLKHLWGDKYCGDDEVEDTPPQIDYNSGCSSFPVIKPGSCNNSPHGDMFMNFMDFSDDACALMFTHGQTKRMRQLFSPSGHRRSILQSPALGVPWNLTEPVAAEAFRWQVYPNPAGNDVFLRDENGGLLLADEYVLFDINGRKLMQGRSANTIHTGKLPSGIYLLQVHTARGSATRKFVKR